ncbi:reverse transcriptase domain-containing protein [Tanacetum coccineum]
MVGRLRYLLHTRPDLTYSVGVVSRYMQSPRESHARAINPNVDIDNGWSTTGHVFYLGTSPITWCSQKQTTVALSSYEAEFMATTAAVCQNFWLRGLLAEVTNEKVIFEHVSQRKPNSRSFDEGLGAHKVQGDEVHQEKVQQEKLKAVKVRLNFKEASQHSESGTLSRRRDLKERLRPRHARSSDTRRRVCPHTREIQGVGHTTAATETLKAATRTLAPEKHNLLLRNIITKEHPYKKRKRCQKVKRDGESTKEFMRRITNPELIKRLHDKIPKSVDEMMRVTTTFLRGEVAASSREQKKSFSSWKQQEAGHK